MKLLITCLTFAAGIGIAQAQSSLWTDPRGLPSGEQWIQRIDERTSSTFRVYQAGENGPTVSLNPQTSEVVKNPVNGVYEAVIREDLIVKEGKKFDPDVQSESGNAPKDNGIPASLSGMVREIQTPETSPQSRTYEIAGQNGTVTFNPTTGELVKDADGQWKAVMREPDALKTQKEKSGSQNSTDEIAGSQSEITINPDFAELAKNADGQYEGVISESAFTGEVWKQRVPGGDKIASSSNSTASKPKPASSKPEERKLVRTEYVPGSYGYISGGHGVGEGPEDAIYGTTRGHTIYYYSDGTKEER